MNKNKFINLYYLNVKNVELKKVINSSTKINI